MGLERGNAWLRMTNQGAGEGAPQRRTRNAAEDIQKMSQDSAGRVQLPSPPRKGGNMSIIRIQLGFKDYDNTPFYIVHEWVISAEPYVWESDALEIARRCAAYKSLSDGTIPRLAIRIQAVSGATWATVPSRHTPEPQDDVDLMFHEQGLLAERSRLFRRIRRATDNDITALVFRLAIEFDWTEQLHQYLDVLGVDRGE